MTVSLMRKQLDMHSVIKAPAKCSLRGEYSTVFHNFVVLE